MKSIICLSIILAIAACQTYPFTVGGECSAYNCTSTSWRYNNTNFEFRCPKSGQYQSQFRLTSSGYIFDFVSQQPEYKLSIPVNYNQNASSNGLQYFGNMNNNTAFAILNCTYPIAKNYTNLCYSHELVGGKIVNNTFQTQCAFGLDRPRSLLEAQALPNY